MLHCGACANASATQREAAAAAAIGGEPKEPFAVAAEPPGEDAAQDASALAAAVKQQEDARPVDDCWPDISDFLSKKFGFLPVALPITEPAVGYGLAAGAAFISKPLGDTAAGFGRPDITFVGGFGTENDSKGVMVGDVRHWFDDRLQTVAAVMKTSVNLDFHRLGDTDLAEPVRVNLEPEGGMLQGKYRVGRLSALWAGLSYAYASTGLSFDGPARPSGIPQVERTSHVGGLTPSLTWDTRDNIFTPTRGTYVEGTFGIYAPAFGSDRTFQRGQLFAMHFEPLARDWFLGTRGRVASAFSDAPFYMDPYVVLRGVPVMRHQGDTAADLETEVRWQFWNRLSLVGVGGVGGVWTGGESDSVLSGGFGFRYELAREYGIHVGLDVAFSEGESAIYLQIGSAWARP